MNAQSRRGELTGAAGRIETLRDEPSDGAASRGLAVIAHPHPLFGGTMDNKVVQTLARAFVQCGWTALRFNFRGVGASEGVHDAGGGETDDLLALLRQAGGRPFALAGFSFGAFVASRALAASASGQQPEKVVLVGTAVARFAVPPVAAGLHPRTLVVHGEQDDTVALQSVMDWARPQSLPVTVIPGCGHFFHGQLPLLKQLVVRHLSS